MKNDDAYANAAHIAGGFEYPARWTAAAEAFRREMGLRARLDLPYGAAPRERFDLFLPEGRPAGLVVFVHGGFWRAFGRETWSHLARGPVGRGWAVAMPSYTLAPEARVAEITGQVARAVTEAAEAVAGPVRLTGHSAGGHTVARMLCADVALPPGVRARLDRAVPISPLADLRPLIETTMNEDMRIDPEEAEAESLLTHRPVRAAEVAVWVGEAERPAFRNQARWLAETWRVPCHVAAGRHHYDVIAPLEDPASDLVAALVGSAEAVGPGGETVARG